MPSDSLQLTVPDACLQASKSEMAGVKDALARLLRQQPGASRPPSAPSDNLAAIRAGTAQVRLLAVLSC